MERPAIVLYKQLNKNVMAHPDSASTFAATTAVTLMTVDTGLLEVFTELILRHKPLAASAPRTILGCVQRQPGEAEPQPHERELFHRSLFSWPQVWPVWPDAPPGASGLAERRLPGHSVLELPRSREVVVDGAAPCPSAAR